MPKKDLADRFAGRSGHKTRRKASPSPARPTTEPRPAVEATPEAAVPTSTPMPAARSPVKTTTRPGSLRARRATPVFDYRYVPRDLKKIVVTVAAMILIMVALSFVIR